jgi:signal transduction histidine kinase
MSPFTRRITLRVSAIVIASTFVVLLAGGWLLQREMVRSIEAMHKIEFRELIELLRVHPGARGADLARLIKDRLGADAALYFIQIHDDQSAILFTSENLRGVRLPDLALGERTERGRVDVPEIGMLHMTEFRELGWHVQIASALGPVWRTLKNYARVSALLVLGTALLSLLMGYAFSRVILRPVSAIEQTARRIGADNMRERVPVPAGRDELSSLAELLNQMFDRLETSFEQIRRFTADASHELKTPLALIRLNAERLRPRLGADPEASASLGDLREGIERMSQVIESMLFLSKAEGGALSLHFKTEDVAVLLGPFVEDARVLAEDHGAIFVFARNDAGEARMEPQLMRQLLLNLVGNAVAVSPTGGTITLESERCGNG